MIWGTLGAARDLSRLREISSVLIRHGLGDLVRRTGLASALERAGQILHWGEAGKSAEIEPQERFRRSLEELGPTFVKLGQVLSTRPDLLAPGWIAELERLHSEVAPVSFDELLPEVEKALGRSPFDVFADVERKPHAAASIAQVHRAKLPSGAPVVLKIRRPGISAKIAADLRLLDHLANLIEHEMPEARRYAPVQVVAQFRRSLERELDLAVEARHVDRFARNFADDPHIFIPKVYWDFTSSLMNVQEYVAGIPGTDLAAIAAADLDRKVLAARGSDAVLKMILVDGFFHADPHPGNVLYLPGNRIALIDFGMVGRLSALRRSQMVDLLGGIVGQDDQAMLEVLLDWTGEHGVDEARLAADVGELAFDFADTDLKDVRISALLQRVAALLREHEILLPADLTLMFKALISLEGLGRQYDPEFRLVDRVRPFLDRALSERYQPVVALRRSQSTLANAFGLLTTVPRDLARLVKDARRGRLRIDLDLKRLDSFGERLHNTIDRMTIGIMTASLVIGSSIVMTVGGGPTVLGVPVLTLVGLLGYLIAFFNSLWIILAIWRSDR
ncbi:MAG: ubiquinone biosynthesis protein UbiB [Hyphomicrobiaceae bacterium]|nr:MAG: ubiquinone biosynthesis protein UbiB [Hyphomicrobiaceae bacterium]